MRGARKGVPEGKKGSEKSKDGKLLSKSNLLIYTRVHVNEPNLIATDIYGYGIGLEKVVHTSGSAYKEQTKNRLSEGPIE